MKKTLLLIVLIVGIVTTKAQSIKEGKEAFDHEQYDLAYDIFSKINASDPKNSLAAYWLAQLNIIRENEKAAYEVLHKALQLRKGKDKEGLINAGLGELHIRDIYKDTAKAREYFVNAIESGSKNLEVIKAIARANVLAPLGDPHMAINLLNQSMDLKNAANDVQLQILLGYAYKKQHDFMNMLRTFHKVIYLNPSFAEGYYILAKSYANLTDKSPYLENLWKAINTNPKYPAPVYELYLYYLSENKPDSAKYYLNLYGTIANKKDPSLQALLSASDAELEYMSKNYQSALEKTAQNTIIYQEQVKNNRAYRGRLWRLEALIFSTMSDKALQAGDTTLAMEYGKKSLEKIRLYIKDENAILDPSDLPYLSDRDFVLYANIAAKYIPEGSPDFEEAYSIIVNMKTKPEEKLVALVTMRETAEKYRYYEGVANAWDSILKIKSDTNYGDLFYAGIANYNAKRFDKAKPLFEQYIKASNSEPIYGFLWLARTEDRIDTASHFKPTVVEAWNKYLIEASNDIEKYKSNIIEANTNIAYNYMLGDRYKESLPYWENILILDPTHPIALATKQQILDYQQQMAEYQRKKAKAEADAKKGTKF
ncbi:MAG: tetratricopeptide repeat protein [Chitinophagaceae bacterium]